MIKEKKEIKPVKEIETIKKDEIVKEVKPIKEIKVVEKSISEEIKNSFSHGLYLGYKIVEDNRVGELRLPKDVIEFLAKHVDWSNVDKHFKDVEIVPDKFYVCFKCGYKRPKIKGIQAGMFLCPKCNKALH